MAEGDLVAELLAQVSFQFLEDIDFTATDPNAVREIVRRLTVAAFRFNLFAVTEFGGRSGQEREPGLVEQGIGAAFQTWEGEDLHPDPFEKAAAIMRGIVQTHPFYDGNKRTGFLTTYYYLTLIGYPAPPEFPMETVVELCVQLSRGEVRDLGIISAQLRDFWQQATN